MTSSIPEMPLRFSFSGGIPRPSSATDQLPSECRVTDMEVHRPSRASSTELSITSDTQWVAPPVEVSPMYIPGRFRTASRPSSHTMS